LVDGSSDGGAHPGDLGVVPVLVFAIVFGL